VTPEDIRSSAPEVAFGVDIGGTKVLGVALGTSDRIVADARVSTPPRRGDSASAEVGDGNGAEAVAQAVAVVVAELDASIGRAAALTPEDAPAVGVGAPGMLDRHGHLRFAPNLPQAQGVDWYALIGGQLPGRTLLIENDANFAALAEHRLGAAQGYSHVLMVTLGTGIGGGLIVDGRVQVGGHGFAGEIGHMVVDPAGPACPCGRRGCWERYASGGGLGVMAREAALAGRLPEVVRVAGGDAESVRGEDVSAAAAAGDDDARRVVAEVGWWVGFGLANLACVVDPECIVLGGGLVSAGDLLLDAATSAFLELVEGGSARETVIVTAAFGDRAGAVGAALAARHGGLWS
jgi:glucokinase